MEKNNKFIMKKASFLKHLMLAGALGITLASCSYDDSDRDPKYVDNDDKKELVFSNGTKIRAVKDRADMGSPIHFKDEDGNRLLWGLDIDSYQELEEDKYILISNDQKGIYDFKTNTYILWLDKYINIDKIWLDWWVVARDGDLYTIINYQTNTKINAQSEVTLVGIDNNMMTKVAWVYQVYDKSWSFVHNTQSSQEPEVDGAIIKYVKTDPRTWNHVEEWVNTSNRSTIPVPNSWWNSQDIQLSNQYKAKYTGVWEFYDVVDSNDSVIVANCYKPIDQGANIYALVDDGFVEKNWVTTNTKRYKLYQIKTSNNRKKVQIIDEYEARKYME